MVDRGNEMKLARRKILVLPDGFSLSKSRLRTARELPVLLAITLGRRQLKIPWDCLTHEQLLNLVRTFHDSDTFAPLGIPRWYTAKDSRKYHQRGGFGKRMTRYEVPRCLTRLTCQARSKDQDTAICLHVWSVFSPAACAQGNILEAA